jgi:hypothetical protein
MRLYVHDPGEEEVAVIEDVSPEVQLASMIEVIDGDYVFFDEDDAPVDLQMTLIEIFQVRGLEQRHHAHVHRHPCLRIAVEVIYNGVTKPVPAVPGSLVEKVLLRAVSEFGIDPVTGADLVFRIPGTNDDLPGSERIGRLTPRGTCSLTLNLLPGHREHG